MANASCIARRSCFVAAGKFCLALSARAFFASVFVYVAPVFATPKIAALSEQITVKIEGATQGSGVLVGKDKDQYTVLTAWHVIKSQGAYEELDIYTSDGLRHSADVQSIERVGDVDMATVRFKSTRSYAISSLKSDGRVASGSKSYVAGFPLPSSAVPGRILRFTTGSIIANARIAIPNGYQLLYSNSTYPGMSGGSVLDQDGLLIGIHGQGEIDSMATQREGLAVKTGTNQAVPISFYLKHKAKVPITSVDSMVSTGDSFSSFEDLLVESKSLLTSYRSGHEDVQSEEKEVQKKYLAAKQDLLDRAILLAEEALRRTETPEAFLMAGTGYLYKKNAHFHLNWNFDDRYKDKPKHERYELEMKRLTNKLLRNLDAAIYLDPNNIDALKYRGSVKEDDERGTGIGDFNKILEIDENNLEGLTRRASSYFALGLGNGWENTSMTQKKAYLRLSIEDSTKALKIDPKDGNTRHGRALAGYELYTYTKFDPGVDSENLLRQACIDAYEAETSGSDIVIFPNLPATKRFISDCESLAASRSPRRYTPGDESTIPASFALDKRYEFMVSKEVCQAGWSTRQCNFHRQYVDALIYMRTARCMIEKGEVTMRSAAESWEFSIAPAEHFSEEIVQLIAEQGGVENKYVFQIIQKDFDRICGS